MPNFFADGALLRWNRSRLDEISLPFVSGNHLMIHQSPSNARRLVQAGHRNKADAKWKQDIVEMIKLGSTGFRFNSPGRAGAFRVKRAGATRGRHQRGHPRSSYLGWKE